jgi:hypothetical protein
MSPPRENQRAARLSLNGEWGLSLAGQAGSVRVPGVWERQGYPLDAEGPAVYTREVSIPAEWAGARVFLRFGAVSYYAEALVNGQPAGTHEGLWTSFEFDITGLIRPGQSNHIELRVIKPGDEGDTYPYREVLVGFIPYVSLTFGGPWREVELLAHSAPAWEDVRLSADWRSGQVRLQAAVVDHDAPAPLTATAEVIDRRGEVVRRAEQTLGESGRAVAFELCVDDPALWSPADPALYRLRLRLWRGHGSGEDAGEILAETERRFGFRGLHTAGERLLLNDAPVHVRGILGWGWDPDTLAPTPTDEQIRDEFRRARELGFNLYKLCLYVPPPRLFEIADEEGMLLWLELPLWWQRLTDHLRRQAPLEYEGILRAVHTHPSLVLVSLGCELGADMADAALLEQLNTLARGWMTGALLCDNSGSGEAFQGLGYDFADFTDYHFYCDLHYFTPLLDHFRRDWRPPRPWIFGEFCANDDYRDPAGLVEPGGGRPWWRDVLGVGSGIERWAYCQQEDRVAAHNLPFSDQDLVRISRQQSFIVRKTIIEQTRTRRDFAGYVVTGLRDTPISTAGILDDFNRHKFDPAAFSAFNADSVLVLEGGRSRVWIDGDRPAPLDRFNHRAGDAVSLRLVLSQSGSTLPGGELSWRLSAPDGALYAQDTQEITGPLEAGPPREVARLEWTFPAGAAPGAWTLAAELGDHTANAWTLWLYPEAAPWPQNIALYDPAGCLTGLDDLPRVDAAGDHDGALIVGAYTPDVAAFVRAGGRAILLQSGAGALPAQPVAFWQESIKLLYDHPALSRFPHDGCADLQFYHLATDHAFDSARFGDAIPGLTRIRPVLRRLHARTFTMLDYLVECEIGSGLLLASTLRLAGGAGDQTRGLRANVAGDFLLREMAAYISGSMSRRLSQLTSV